MASRLGVAPEGGRRKPRPYPHPPGLPIRRMCGKVHRDLSDAIGAITATYAPLADCSVWNLMYLSIYLSTTPIGSDNWLQQYYSTHTSVAWRPDSLPPHDYSITTFCSHFGQHLGRQLATRLIITERDYSTTMILLAQSLSESLRMQPAPIGANEPADVQKGIAPTRVRWLPRSDTCLCLCGLRCMVAYNTIQGLLRI